MKKLFTFCCIVVVVFFQGCKKESPVTTTPPPPPPPPVVLSCTANLLPASGAAIAGGSAFTLTWNSASGAIGYDVYLGATNTPSTIVAANITATTTTYSLPNINATYYWYVLPKYSSGAASGCQSSVTSFTTQLIQAPPGFGFYVVGYFPNYRNLADVPEVKFRMCNVVNYAFFGVNSTGTLTVNNAALVPQVVTKAKTNNAKVFVSINDGSGDGTSNFTAMASSAAGRNNFIKDLMNKVRQYNFDGVDIDWEFPRADNGTDVTFTALIKELSDSLHRDAKYYLSIAVIAGKYSGPTRDAIKTEVFGYADFFNVMAYDDFSGTVPFKQHSDAALATTCLNYWLNTRGMPKEKCVLGIPAYGRASGISQTGTTMAYRTILAQGGSSQTDSTVITSNVNYPAGYKIYYNGQPTVTSKTLLAQQRGNGIMMWEKWNDAPDGNSLLKAACDAIGRGY